MKRVQLQLPDSVVAWVDAQADGMESRAAYLRRSIVGLMKADLQRQAFAQRAMAAPAPSAQTPAQPLAQAQLQPVHPASNEPWASL
jgi:hypothetical protein